MTDQGRKRKKNPGKNKVRPHQEGEQGESEPGPSPQRETHSSVEGDQSRSPEDEGWNLSHFVVRSPIPMVWTDSNERILGFNEAFCHFSGFPKKRISGQPLNVLLPGWETLKPLVLNGQPACTVMTLAEANAESTLTGQNVKVQCVPSDCGFLVQFYRPLTHTDKTPFYFPKGLTGRQDPDWVILTLDSNFHIIDFTGNCESVTGYSGDEIAGKTADNLFPTWNTLIYNLFDGSDAIGQQLSKGLEIIKKDGSCEVLGAYFSRFISGSFYLMLRKYPGNKRKKTPFPADEELYRFLIENLNDLVVIVNQNHQLTYVSPSYCQFFAKREEELIGHSFFPLIHPDDRESTARIMEELKNPPHRCYVEQRVMDGNGEWKWLAWSDRAIVDPFGEVKEVIGVGRDITEKKRAEEALQASEEKYRKLHESLRDGFARSDLSGRLLEFNEAFKKITGYNDEELQLTNFRNFTPENWVSIEDEMLQNQLFKRGYTDVYEKEYYHRDGHRIPVEVRAYLLKDDAGSPSGFWAIVRDITERKMVEKELRLLRSIVEISTEAIAISTPDGNLVYLNPAHEQLFGKSVSSFPRINFRDFYPPESIAYLDTHVIPTLMKGIPWEGELNAFNAKGELFPLWEKANVVRDENGFVAYMFGLMHDMTLKKNEECLKEKAIRSKAEEEERLRLARELHDHIGHLMTAIKLRLENQILRQKKTHDCGDLGEILGMIQIAFKEIRLVSSRLTSHEPEDVSLKEAIASLVKDFNKMGTLTAFADTTAIPDILPVNIRNNLLRIIEEALTNAAKHSGSPDVWISSFVKDQILRIQVKDLGRGMQENDPILGSGLRFMKQRAESMGGSLSIENIPGTSFTLIVQTPLPDPDSPDSGIPQSN